MQVLLRVVRELSTGTMAMAENEKFLAALGKQPSLINSVVNSALEAGMRVNDFVKEFVLAAERHKRCGSPPLDFLEQIKWSASELIFHFRCLNRVYEALGHVEAERMLKSNLDVIRDLEALLGCVLSVDNLQRVLEAEVASYPDHPT